MSSSECQKNICCDPYSKHKVHIKKNLRRISELDVSRNPNLKIGLYWCHNCRNYNVVGEASTSTGHASDKIDDNPEMDEEPNNPNAGSILEGLDKCCNPYNIHSKAILKGLRPIKDTDLLRLSTLTLGLLGCDTCRKANPTDYLEKEDKDVLEPGLATLFKEIAEELRGVQSGPSSQEFSQASSSSVSPNLSPVVHKESATRSLQALGLSPLITSGIKTKGGKVSIVKRKLEEATAVVKKKLCRALSAHPDDIETTESIKAKDYDQLLDEISKRLPLASQREKYQLLSLVPLSMTINEASNFFGVSRTLLQKARDLRQEKGILAVPDFKRVSTVLQSTKDLVVAYYCSDENSKALPGARDCVSIKKGVYEQKRLILSNLSELYQAFKRDYPGLKISISIFCSLRQKWCVFAGSSGTHEQCICQIHQNFKLILHALDMKASYQDLVALCVCDLKDTSCLLRLCEKCPTLNNLIEILRQQITLPDISKSEYSSSEDERDYFEEAVKYRQWKSTDSTDMQVLICTRLELIEILAKQMNKFIPQDFISSSQRDFVKKLKKDLPMNKAVVAMDFSMNYNCLVQGAVQSYHWSPTQATLHPTGIYYKDDQDEVKYKSIIFISDDLHHDVTLVKKFLERTMLFIKENFPRIIEIEYVTDGCSKQYKK